MIAAVKRRRRPCAVCGKRPRAFGLNWCSECYKQSAVVDGSLGFSLRNAPERPHDIEVDLAGIWGDPDTVIAATTSGLSPLLGNVYLHYALDVWFDQVVRPRLRGRATLVRYADDFVIGFERRDDAERVMDVLRDALAASDIDPGDFLEAVRPAVDDDDELLITCRAWVHVDVGGRTSAH